MNLPEEIKQIFEKFKENNFQAFVVGGAVRDLILGREFNDWDFTTDAKPEEILELFPQGFYNNKFGTVGIPSELGILEVTTMRREGDYRDSRHPVDVSWTDRVEEDLARRDFTINAMALDSEGNLVDPFGGQEDLKEKLIKAVGNPQDRFREDALRLIRAIRIATQIEFEIEKETFEAIKQNAQTIEKIASERIRDELLKIISTMNPYMGIVKLRESGILQIILPELEACFGIYQEGPKHDREYDIGEHSLLTLKHTPSSDPIVRLAALLHDIGKVKTYNLELDGNVTFYNHDVMSGQLARTITKRFNFSRIQADKLFRLVRYHMFSINENQTDAAVRRFIKNVGLENIEDMFALRVGDRLGGGTAQAVSWRMEKYKERIAQVLTKPFSITDLKVNGNDVMEVLNIKPGRKVGEVLNTLFEEVLEDSSKNNREYLTQRIKEL